METETTEEYVPKQETFDVIRVEIWLTETEGVIDRGAENIKLTAERRL